MARAMPVTPMMTMMVITMARTIARWSAMRRKPILIQTEQAMPVTPMMTVTVPMTDPTIARSLPTRIS